MRQLGFLFLSLTLLVQAVSFGQAEEDLQLTLPAEIYAVEGVEMNIFFDNLVLTLTPENYQFDVDCAVGQTEARKWTTVPEKTSVGMHTLSVAVQNKETQRQVTEASTKLHVVAADAGSDTEISVLIIGDSLTHATQYPNEIARLLSQPGNPSWEMFGTHKPTSAAEGVAHEGYGGWTWQRFATKYEPNPDGTYRKRSSPFVFLVDEQPKLDMQRYWKEYCQDQRPDFVVIMLGINDCFSAPADSPDARISEMFEQAEPLLKAIRQTSPKSKIGICLTTPPNSRQEAFEANYKDRYSRWNWKRIQHRLVQRQIDHFRDQRRENISLIPTELNLDPIDGYPDNNAVHPNVTGYQQIGRSIYAWLKWQLSQK